VPFISQASPPARFWSKADGGSDFKTSIAVDHLDPEVPEWIENIWVWHHCPEVKGSESYGPKGRALLWLVAGGWCASRKPYRFSLPKPLLNWLNATEFDFTHLISRRPTLEGSSPSSAFKPISRFMRAVWEERSSDLRLADIEGYFDFIAQFAFNILPACFLRR
jgi:hypothetical protein